jgi:ribonuclease P protein component
VAQLERLRRRADFQDVYSRGVKVVGRYLVVFLAAGRSVGGRYGITVTRRVGNAVTRNRSRRRIRELVRGWQPAAWPAFDLVINARSGCAAAKWPDLGEDFLRCLVKAGRLLWGRG